MDHHHPWSTGIVRPQEPPCLYQQSALHIKRRDGAKGILYLILSYSNPATLTHEGVRRAVSPASYPSIPFYKGVHMDLPPRVTFDAASAAERPNWRSTPSMRWVELMFLTMVICQQVALPWRETMVE